MARFVSHESCPNCGSRDNLGRYDDGSAFCYGCHYVEKRTGVSTYVAPTNKEYPSPPDDACHDFSQECVAWLEQYGVGVVEAIQRGLTWSPSRNQLIFNMDDIWQARNFGGVGHGNTKRSKYFTSGNVLDVLPIYYYLSNNDGVIPVVEHNETLIVVEDCVSALRIARQCDSMPVLGSHLASQKLERIARLYSSLVVWLDSDKYKEALDISTRAKLLGLQSRVIHTDLDPKCYTDEQIKGYLND